MKKNTKLNIMNLATMLLTGLVFVFMACAHITSTIEIANNSQSNSQSGYSLIESLFESSEAIDVSIAVMLIIVAVLAGLLFICALINLLVNLKVIKGKKVSKIMNNLSLLLSIVFVLVGLIATILLAVRAGDLSVESVVGSAKTCNGWGQILNFVITILVAGLMTGNLLTSKKK